MRNSQKFSNDTGETFRAAIYTLVMSNSAVRALRLNGRNFLITELNLYEAAPKFRLVGPDGRAVLRTRQQLMRMNPILELIFLDGERQARELFTPMQMKEWKRLVA